MGRWNGFSVAAMALLPMTAFGSTIYDNTILSGAATGLTGSQRTIQIDDVLVPSSRDPLNLPLAINSITVDLQAGPGQSGMFSLYVFPVQSDGTPAPNPVLIDTASVTFTSPFQLVTFGTGSGPLFTVDPDFSAQPGFGLIYIGLEASAIPAANWLWANGPDANLPTAYLDNVTAGQIFLNTSPGPPFPPNVSFYVKVDGAPVPEPASILLLATAMFVLGVLLYRGPKTDSQIGAALLWHSIVPRLPADHEWLSTPKAGIRGRQQYFRLAAVKWERTGCMSRIATTNESFHPDKTKTPASAADAHGAITAP